MVPATPFGNWAAICRMIKIEHSIFALPFAYAGAFMAAGGLPPWGTLFLLTVAMAAIRSFAMAFNRVADLRYDRRNPRTARRPLVTGEISPAQTWFFCAVMAGIFILACAAINMLCLALALPALAVAAGYSFLKRVTWLCHFWLGATLGLAPLAGWICVRPTLTLTPVLLALGATFWVAGFDILYSCQDAEFDRAEGLRSIPACFGIAPALNLAAFSHVDTAVFLLLAGWSGGLSFWWYVVWAGASGLLFWEHQCITAHDLSRMNMAFFTLNGAISVLVLLGVVLGIYC